MAEKRQHNATMNSKGLEDALDDDTVRQMIETQGARSLLLVEVVHGPFVNALDGTQRINLIPGVVVRVPDEDAKPVRDLLRALALGGPQALAYEDAGDAFVPPKAEAQAGVQAVADKAKAAAEAAQPEPTPATGDDGGNPPSDPGAEDKGDDGLEGGGEPWPGDEGYDAPGDPEPATEPAGDAPADDLAAKRAQGGRAKAAGGK